jgi:hypothetical protein
MKKIDKKRIQYYVLCIGAFARQKGMSQSQAFSYLNENKGIKFLIDCYDAEHTLSLEDAVDDLTRVCKNSGGVIE